MAVVVDSVILMAIMVVIATIMPNVYTGMALVLVCTICVIRLLVVVKNINLNNKWWE